MNDIKRPEGERFRPAQCLLIICDVVALIAVIFAGDFFSTFPGSLGLILQVICVLVLLFVLFRLIILWRKQIKNSDGCRYGASQEKTS